MTTAPGFDVEFPLVVVGAGGAGMMAALRAAELGREVLLLEKDARRSCNTELSGGLIQGAGTRYQAALGLVDSPALMMADIMTKNKGVAESAVVRAICERSAEVVHFLADYVGLELHLDSVKYFEHSTLRLHATPSETGRELVTGLRSALGRSGRITFADRTEVVELIMDGPAVVGVATAGASAERVRADAVVLACDGFGANADMIREFCPEIVGATYIGCENNTGQGIRWGAYAGAALDRMTAYQGHCHVNPKHGTRLGGAMFSLGSIIVNLQGRRFEREDQGYSEFARVILRQAGGVGVEIFDQRIFDSASTAASFREASAVGAIRRADTPRELAALFGIPPDAVEEEVEAYDQACLQGHDRLERAHFGEPLAPPFYGSVVTGALVHTQGGLRIDPGCLVIRENGTSIPGLYAAGGTAAGISGDGPAGYLTGNGLIQALATGYIAGESTSTGIVQGGSGAFSSQGGPA